jgi:beta-phosphoglucomutase-like phosphatase (HAD superfamily)
MAYRGIIFDLNGVLWWDGALQEQAWKQFSAELRGWPLTGEELAVQMHGRNNRHTLEYLVGRPVVGEELLLLTEEKEAIYRRLCLEQGPGFQLSPGAADLLGFLVAHDISRTIATAAGKANVDFFVAHLHFDHWFDTGRIVYDDGSRPGKPAPDTYLEAARVLALIPAQCVVVEDSQSGIQAAHAAGIGCVIALGPGERHEELGRMAGVGRFIDRLGELPAEDLFA